MEQLLERLSMAGLLVSGLLEGQMGIMLEECMYVDTETFLQFFGSTDGSNDELVEADQGKGYTRYFDKWKAEGILH